MSRSLNKVTLIGNLTRDIEIKFTPSNMAVGNLGIALNREWTTPQGEKREEVTFVDCEVWGKAAEILQKYTRKGSKVYLEGRLKLDQWKDKTDGSNRTKIKVVVEDFMFLDGKGDTAGGGSATGANSGMPSRGGQFDDAGGDNGPSPTPNQTSGSRGGYAAPSSSPGRNSQPAEASVGEDDIPF